MIRAGRLDKESLRSGQAYDALYRLTGAEYSTGEYYHYTYDPVGNRLSLTTTGGVVDYEDARISTN